MSRDTTLNKRIGDEHFSLHGKVIAELRAAIVTRRLKPGQRLVEGRLAEQLGVSRNPVREAIRALASEGLVEVTARRGASVATMSDQEAREIIEVRALLEGHNARLAARRQDRQVLQRIEIVLEQGSDAVAAGRFEELPSLNQQFHLELGVAGRNSVLREILTRLRERTATLFSPTEPSRQARSWDEHAAILRAIIAGDERTAATLAADHVVRAGADFLVGLDAASEASTELPIRTSGDATSPRPVSDRGPGRQVARRAAVREKSVQSAKPKRGTPA